MAKKRSPASPQRLVDRLVERAARARDRFPPVTDKIVKAAEKKLGFALPPLLRDVYLEVANGGIGVGNSLLCLKAPTRDVDDLVTRYVTQTTEVPPPPFHPWPARFLTIADLGCNVTFELDWQDPAGPVYELDMNAGDPEAPWEDSMELHSPSLAEWFEGWLSGK